MTKWLSSLIVVLLTFSAISYITNSRSPQTVQATFSGQCEYTCPVIHWTWQTREEDVVGHYIYTDKILVIDDIGHYTCPGGWTLINTNKCHKKWNIDQNATWVEPTYKWVCPVGYSSNPGHDNCRKWIDTTYKTVSHSANVAYEKSSDPHKCHRPSDNTLTDSYKMDHDTRHDFKDHNSEWLDSTPNEYCLSPSPTETECPRDTLTPSPTSEVTNSPTPTTEPEGSPSPTPTTGEEVTSTPIPTATPTSQSNNDNGGSSSGGGGGNPEPYTCNDADPGAPKNLQATALGGGQVKLTWEHAPGPHTTYVVAYGPSIGNYLYGDPNVGNVTSYIVKALNPGGNYCFYVQAQNGCKGGVPSNVVCTNQPNTLRVLGAKTNYNPLVDGIKQSYGGEVLGESTILARTAEVTYSSEKLPSGNTEISNKYISIPSIGINSQSIYSPQSIGNELTVGNREVLETTLNDTTLFYGHNGTDVFGSLFKIKTGAKITISDNGKNSEYVVVKTEFVGEGDISAVKADSNGEIVLMTCSWTYPDHRILIKAIPSSL